MSSYKDSIKRQVIRHRYRIVKIFNHGYVVQFFAVPSEFWNNRRCVNGLSSNNKERMYRGFKLTKTTKVKVGDEIEGYIVTQTGGKKSNRGKKLLIWCFPGEKFVLPALDTTLYSFEHLKKAKLDKNSTIPNSKTTYNQKKFKREICHLPCFSFFSFSCELSKDTKTMIQESKEQPLTYWDSIDGLYGIGIKLDNIIKK